VTPSLAVFEAAIWVKSGIW